MHYPNYEESVDIYSNDNDWMLKILWIVQSWGTKHISRVPGNENKKALN